MILVTLPVNGPMIPGGNLRSLFAAPNKPRHRAGPLYSSRSEPGLSTI